MALDKDMEQLARVPILAGLDRDALRLLAFAAEPRRLSAGEVLFRHGEEAHGAVLVVSGHFDLAGPPAAGAPDRTAGPGSLLDEEALLATTRHRATATARDAAAVLEIARGAFLRALGEHPANAIAIRRYWAGKLHRKLARLRGRSRP